MQDYLYNLAADRYMGFFPGVIKFFLFILSLVYGLVIRLLIAVCERKQYQPACKVISVGNITLGGTGKTPLVEYIAKYLKANGHSAAVVTRGYKRKRQHHLFMGLFRQPRHPSGLPRNDTYCVRKNYETMGDEPYMLQKKLKDIPVIVDADRMRAIKFAVANYGAGTVILDDGFQQWGIKKDLEIVVIDAVNPFGNKQMIPRGILRQPISSLKKADIFVLSKTNINPPIKEITGFLKGINPDALIVEAAHQPMGLYELGAEKLLDIHTFSGQTAALVSGIGDPDSFEKIVKSLGIIVRAHFKFPDHHYYSNRDMHRIAEFCKQQNIRIIITTEKDAVKLSSFQLFPPRRDPAIFYRSGGTAFSFRLFVLPIELKPTRYEQEFSDRLSGLYSV